MPLLTNYSLNPKDEPTLQQLQNYLQYLSQDKKAAIAMTAIYEATEPSAVDFDHVCDRCPKFNKAIALLQDLSRSGLLAVARAIAEELAVLEQLQGVKSKARSFEADTAEELAVLEQLQGASR